MPNPAGVPAFGGVIPLPRGSGDADVLAYWQDGSMAVGILGESVRWVPLASPSFAVLFPDRVTRTGFDMTPQDKVAEMARNIPLPFRGDLPAQPRPDDADPLTYPARGGAR